MFLYKVSSAPEEPQTSVLTTIFRIVEKAWYLYDLSSSHQTGSLKKIDPFTTNWMKRRYYYIEKCKDAQSLGIVVATLTAKGYLDVVKHIQKLAKVAQERLTIRDVYEMLTIPSKNSWSAKASVVPAHGLYLCQVEYNEKDKEFPVGEDIEHWYK